MSRGATTTLKLLEEGGNAKAGQRMEVLIERSRRENEDC